jgi:hypothetical protein
MNGASSIGRNGVAPVLDEDEDGADAKWNLVLTNFDDKIGMNDVNSVQFLSL